MGRPGVGEKQEFDGLNFYEDKMGYFVHKTYRGPTVYMHRYVWVFFKGEIPVGMWIHHMDHDKSNNNIDNLALVSAEDHGRYHTKLRLKENPEQFARAVRAAQAAAPKWHRSAEGREWHSEHGKQCWVGKEKETFKCPVCGKPFQAFAQTQKRGFCSPSCQNKARRASGVDNEQRTCVVCEKSFTINRYSKRQTCGHRSCIKTLREKTLKGI